MIHKETKTLGTARLLLRKFKINDAGVICAENLSRNPESGKVMIKSCLKYEGTLRGRFVDSDGIRNDLLSYSLTKEEHKKRIVKNRILKFVFCFFNYGGNKT